MNTKVPVIQVYFNSGIDWSSFVLYKIITLPKFLIILYNYLKHLTLGYPNAFL